MSEIMYVLKHKNLYEKEERKRRQQELEELREDGMFRVALNKDIEVLRALFSDPEVEVITVNIPEDLLSKFLSAIYFEEMSEFKIKQVSADKYRFSRKEINF